MHVRVLHDYTPNRCRRLEAQRAACVTIECCQQRGGCEPAYDLTPVAAQCTLCQVTLKLHSSLPGQPLLTQALRQLRAVSTIEAATAALYCSDATRMRPFDTVEPR